MSGLEWPPEKGGSQSSDHDTTESGIFTKGAEAILGGEVTVIVAMPWELGDPKGGSFKNPKGELLEDQDPKEEPQRDSEGDLLPGLTQSKIRELALIRL